MEVVHGPTPRRVITPLRVLAAVVVLLVAVGALLWLWPRGSEPGGEGVAAPEAPADGAPADDPADDPDEGDGFDLRAAEEEIGRIGEQVAEVRRLDLQRPISARFEPIAELVSRLEDLTAGADDAAGSEASRARLLETLGLLPPGADVASSLRTVYDETVVGFYVPRDEQLYINRSTTDMTPWTRWASAHEVVHALQDQHFDLGGLLSPEVGALDQELARLSLVEGDAVVTQVTWAKRFLTDEEQAELDGDTGPAGATPDGDLPPYLVARFEFPYEVGPDFVAALLAAGHLGAVDEALRDRPPTTSAQILHPRRYLDGIDAVAVPMTADPGEDWEPDRHDEFGEFDLHQLLAAMGEEAAADLAAGWAGGQARSFVRDADTAVGVGLVFDTAEDAADVCDALPAWWERSADGTMRGQGVGDAPDGGWLAYRCTETRVDLARAPEERAVRGLTSDD